MREKLRAILRGLIPKGSVLQRSVKSGIWMTATKFSARSLQIFLLIVLARLLSPRDFGLAGIALLTLAATKQFTTIGLNSALIQQVDENVDSYLNTTWCLEISRGLFIFGVLFLGAPLIATVFDEPQSIPIIRVLALSPVLYGLRNPGVVYFKKHLNFHRDFLYQTSGSVTQFVVGVAYALYSPTVWALVVASVSRPAVKLLLSYVLHDYRPWLEFDWDVARELVNFGKWITGGSILSWFSRQGDDAFIGWFVSATALGFYQYAYRIADTPATEVSGIISNITFPAYSTLQEDTERLQQALMQSIRFISFVAFPMAFGTALVAPSFVSAVLGEEWTPAIVPMQILAIYGLLHAITRNFGSLWKALDRPDLIVKTSLVRIALIAVLIWPATARFGITGTALVVTGVYAFPMLPIDVYLTTRLIQCQAWVFYREYAYPFVAASTMFGTLWCARTVISVSPLVELLVLVPSGVVVYAVASFLLERRFEWGIKQNIQMLIDGVRS